MTEFGGRFYDGKTATAQDVRIGLSHGTVEIRAGTQVIARWPDHELRLVDRDERDHTTRLTRVSDNAARLVVQAPDFLAALKAACPAFARRVADGRNLGRRIALWTVGLAALAALSFAAVRFLPDAAARIIPLSWEEEIGRRVVDQVTTLFMAGGKQTKFCTNVRGQAALDLMVKRLTGKMDSPYRLKVTVIASPVMNAFAAPGGHVVLLRGLIDTAASPDGVAGILAHEFSHVIHRHPMQAVVRAFGLSLLLNALTGDIAGSGMIAGIAQLVIGAAYSRSAETDADATAVGILVAAGISTRGLEEFFRRLTAKESVWQKSFQRNLGFLSSHPRSAERAEAVAGMGQAGKTRPALAPADWKALKEICASK